MECQECGSKLVMVTGEEITRVYAIDEDGQPIKCLKTDNLNGGDLLHWQYVCNKCGYQSETKTE